MTELEVKKSVFERSAKLFFFCFMSESKALKLAKAVVDRVFIEEPKDWDEHSEKRLLQTLHSIYSSNDKKSSRAATSPILGHFEIPKSLDLGAWREFKRSSHSNEFYTTCLFYIGGFEIPVISDVLGVSDGAVKFRLSHGSKKLGSILLKEYLN